MGGCRPRRGEFVVFVLPRYILMMHFLSLFSLTLSPLLPPRAALIQRRSSDFDHSRSSRLPFPLLLFHRSPPSFSAVFARRLRSSSSPRFPKRTKTNVDSHSQNPPRVPAQRFWSASIGASLFLFVREREKNNTPRSTRAANAQRYDRSGRKSASKAQKVLRGLDD